MQNALIRTVRTFLQVFVGLLLAGWADVANLNDFLSLAQTAAVAAIPAVLSLIQNLLEDKGPVDAEAFKG
jgi:hypothetical protein